MNIISLFRIKLIELIHNKGSSDPDQPVEQQPGSEVCCIKIMKWTGDCRYIIHNNDL